jgi:hypothetical protein
MRTVSSALIALSPPSVFDRIDIEDVEEDPMRSNTHARPVSRSVVALCALTLVAAACGSADDGAQGDAVASLRDLGSVDGASDADSATTDHADHDPASSDPASGDSADTSVDGSSDDSSLEAPDDPEEAFALFDQCLQDHGVDPGEGPVFAGGDSNAIAVAPSQATPAGGSGPDSQVFVYGQSPDGSGPPEIDQKMIDAMEACRGHLANATPDFDLSPEQQAALEDAQLAFQQCMEDHGIEGGGFSISIGGGPSLSVNEKQDDDAAPPPTVDVDPEQFQAAAKECQSVYDDYPELKDVLPQGAPVGGVTAAGGAQSDGGS